jgi:hypothetical protein
LNIEHVMDFIVDHRSPGLPPEGLAEVFNSLAWCMADDANVITVARHWLELDDEYRVAVSLWIDDIFPANTREGLVVLAADIQTRFPALAARANDWIRRWDNAYGNDNGI